MSFYRLTPLPASDAPPPYKNERVARRAGPRGGDFPQRAYRCLHGRRPKLTNLYQRPSVST